MTGSTTTKTLFINGENGHAVIVDSFWNEGTPREISSYPITNAYPYFRSTNFHSAYPYLQLKGYLYAASASFPQVNAETISWSDGGCDCFSANTLISMADGTNKKICDVQVGEKVLGVSGSINTVTFIEKVLDSAWGYLYSPDPKYKPFITVNHPIYTNGKLSGINPQSIQDMYPWLGSIEKLEVFDIVPATGSLVYNLWVTGDGTYTANGYGTHSILYAGGFLSVAFKRGWLTQTQVTDILIYFTNKGAHTQYGAYLINKVLKYIKPEILLKPIATSLVKETGVAKGIVASTGRILGKLLHPNKGVN